MQVVPQEIPAGVDVTVPDPVPDRCTVIRRAPRAASGTETVAPSLLPPREFLETGAQRMNSEVRSIDEAALRLLTEYSWPGNLRQLRNTVERAVVLSRGDTITADVLGTDIAAGPEALLEIGGEKEWTLDQLEERYIEQILQQTRHQFSKAAAILGINRKTLLEKRRKYGLK